MISVLPVSGVDDRLTTSLSSPRVLATILLVALVVAACATLARRFLRRPIWVAAAVALPLAIATVVLAAPYFNQRQLDEALPAAAIGVPTAAPTASPTASAAASPRPTAPAAPVKAVVTVVPTTPAKSAAPVAPTSQPAALLATATLRGLGGHQASGRVELHRLADGRIVLRFANVDIEGTPTPRVYLIPGADRQRPGGQALGELRAEQGSFNYRLSGVPGRPVTVLVWCQRYAVPVAGATFSG